MSPDLVKKNKLMSATKQIANYGNAGFYQVLFAEVGSKQGFSISGLVFNEIHTWSNRKLYDALTNSEVFIMREDCWCFNKKARGQCLGQNIYYIKLAKLVQFASCTIMDMISEAKMSLSRYVCKFF